VGDEDGRWRPAVAWVWDNDLAGPVRWALVDRELTACSTPGDRLEGAPWRLYRCPPGRPVPDPERDPRAAEAPTLAGLERWTAANDLP
jgi:hypothetical protein